MLSMLSIPFHFLLNLPERGINLPKPLLFQFRQPPLLAGDLDAEPLILKGALLGT